MERLRANYGSAVSATIVWHELWFGADRLPKSARKSVIESYLTEVLAGSIEFLPYDEAAARWHAAERARLAGLGRMPAFADGQIAAIAVTRGLVLVTRNVEHFQDFDGLEVENWFG